MKPALISTACSATTFMISTLKSTDHLSFELAIFSVLVSLCCSSSHLPSIRLLLATITEAEMIDFDYLSKIDTDNYTIDLLFSPSSVQQVSVDVHKPTDRMNPQTLNEPPHHDRAQVWRNCTTQSTPVKPNRATTLRALHVHPQFDHCN